MDIGKKRMGVLVGCNYPNTKNELKGCINDVESMKEVLIQRFGFDTNHIEVLIDEPGSSLLPTGANIKGALNRMIGEAEAGDVLFFHYSGHGTKLPSKDKSREDEAIVPCDFNLITDVDFRQLVNRIPKGASFTMLSDSCHSDGLIDKEKEQVGPNSTTQPSKEEHHLFHHHHIHNHKHISHESLLAHLASLTNLEASDLGAHLSALFGSDATSKFQMDETDQLGRVHPDSDILLSGCQPNETSANLAPFRKDHHKAPKAHGAFTYAVCTIFKEYPGPLSNRQVVMLARQMLKEESSVTQHPCLYCSDQNSNAPFLWQPEEED